MRADILELMAEEISGRPVGKLASFLRFEDGKAKLDGMHAGKKWDVEGRDQSEWDRANKVELRKLSKRNTNRKNAAAYNETSKAWHKRNRARRTKYEREYWTARKDRLAKLQKAKRARQKADPARHALVLARLSRYRARKKVSNG
jgi:hypothetical protein